jgi:hypothetical protein
MRFLRVFWGYLIENGKWKMENFGGLVSGDN